MIELVDRVLRDLFLADVPGLRPVGGGSPVDGQVRFQAPDESWQNYVGNLVVATPAGSEHVNALNVYLCDLRENRKLRSNERVSRPSNGAIVEERAPARVDCHYLITAWSPVQVTQATEPALDEHALLAQVVAVLEERTPLNPTRVYPPGSPKITALPELIQDADLPTQVLPPDGFPRIGDFWNAMGVRGRWKPAVYLVITVPVAYPETVAGPPVTTLEAGYGPGIPAAVLERVLDVGGLVLNPGGEPVKGAWVRLETPGGRLLQTADTDELGRFVFTRITANPYHLRAGAAGIGAADDSIDVPSPNGHYDLQLS